MRDERISIVRWSGLFAGPLLAVAAVSLVPDSRIVSGEDVVEFAWAGRATLGLMAWMAVWWITEAVDVAVTALLPLAVLPIATVGVYGSAAEAIAAAAAPYADPLIALFMGGFLLALSMQRWGLHRRLALHALRGVGSGAAGIVAMFMAISAVLSMWVSNTATAVMLLPIALSVIGLLEQRADGGGDHRLWDNFPRCLLLGIAYAASIGGIGTLIGTPPNLILAAFVEDQYGVTISFARWMVVGLPIVVVFAPVTWLLLTRVLYPVRGLRVEGSRALLRQELAELGPPKRGEWITFCVFMLTAMAWLTRPLLVPFAPGLTDAGIAVIASLALFVLPVSLRPREFTMNWETAAGLPWGILILFGGGLSLAAAVKAHGVADLIGAQAAGLHVLPGLLIVVVVATAVIFLTELTSNTATTATLLPILAGLAPALDMNPALLLVPAAVAASCAFMMPVATPPNAIVFGSGHLTIPQMCRAGIWLNLIGIALVTLLAYGVVAPLLALAP